MLLIVVMDGFGKILVNVVRMTQFLQAVAALLFFSIWGCGVLTMAQVLRPVMRYSNGHLPQAHQMQMPLSLMWLEVIFKHFYSQLVESREHYEICPDCANLFCIDWFHN